MPAEVQIAESGCTMTDQESGGNLYVTKTDAVKDLCSEVAIKIKSISSKTAVKETAFEIEADLSLEFPLIELN